MNTALGIDFMISNVDFDLPVEVTIRTKKKLKKFNTTEEEFKKAVSKRKSKRLVNYVMKEFKKTKYGAFLGHFM